MNGITYRTGTALGPFSKDEMDSFRRMLLVDMPGFDFDADYVAFMTLNNGGQPLAKYFKLRNTWSSVDRILNFADSKTALRADLLFNVHQNWNLIEDRLLPGMFPFAVLPGGDFLLFDHRSSIKPVIVLWYHEKSREQDPSAELVAARFADFVAQLQSKPSE